jgi:hypothetical protein
MQTVKVLALMLLMVGVVGLAGAYTIQTENKGEAHITLDGGKNGPVPFPHHAHQTALEDCKVCHDLFPQKAGAINALKASDGLKAKQVMNKLCTKCHKELKKEGKKTGPTTCKTCHAKK